jgi:hypothetical protein
MPQTPKKKTEKWQCYSSTAADLSSVASVANLPKKSAGQPKETLFQRGSPGRRGDDDFITAE